VIQTSCSEKGSPRSLNPIFASRIEPASLPASRFFVLT
jgi:hypothetical protein